MTPEKLKAIREQYNLEEAKVVRELTPQEYKALDELLEQAAERRRYDYYN